MWPAYWLIAFLLISFFSLSSDSTKGISSWHQFRRDYPNVIFYWIFFIRLSCTTSTCIPPRCVCICACACVCVCVRMILVYVISSTILWSVYHQPSFSLFIYFWLIVGLPSPAQPWCFHCPASFEPFKCLMRSRLAVLLLGPCLGERYAVLRESGEGCLDWPGPGTGRARRCHLNIRFSTATLAVISKHCFHCSEDIPPWPSSHILALSFFLMA